MLATMSKPKKPQVDAVLHMRMPDFLEDALQRFINDQIVKPDRTAVGLAALEEFFHKHGYLPYPDPSKKKAQA